MYNSAMIDNRLFYVLFAKHNEMREFELCDKSDIKLWEKTLIKTTLVEKQRNIERRIE